MTASTSAARWAAAWHRSSGRPNNLLEPDDDEIEEDTGGPLAAVGYTVIWYGVPVVLFVLYMLVLNGGQQAHALDTLAGAAPQFGLSLVLSMVVAVGLRWASGSWKAASVGLAAAVMGGGLATVLIVRDHRQHPELSRATAGTSAQDPADGTKGAPAEARRAVRASKRMLLGADHVHRERRGHLGVQLDLDVVRARGLDVTRQLEPAPVQRRTAGGLDRVDDLGRGDRAEQAAAVAGARRQRDLEAGELVLDLVGLAQVADLTGRRGPA